MKTGNCSNIITKLHCSFLLLTNNKQAKQAVIVNKQENYNTQTKEVDDALVYERLKKN
jgi:hypothetical protein